MKLINIFTFGAAFGMLLSSCGKDDGANTLPETGEASLKITLAGTANTRGHVEPALALENQIVDYTVYVVNAGTGKIQAVRNFTSGLTNTIDGLTTGAKRVVVVANVQNSGVTELGVGADISGLDTPQLLLDSQIPANVTANGLVMSGEASVTLAPGANVLPTPLTISRVVAKVRLGNVSYLPDAGQTGTFVLQNVMIMKAREEASIGAGTIYTGPGFYGGQPGTVSIMQRDFLTEAITLADFSERFFYVFPNDNTDGNATLLTLKATYDGNTVYFPIRINNSINGGGSTTDGTFITRNRIYTINVVIKKPANGSTDPETPIETATLEITVTPADWETELIQNEEI